MEQYRREWVSDLMFCYTFVYCTYSTRIALSLIKLIHNPHIRSSACMQCMWIRASVRLYVRIQCISHQMGLREEKKHPTHNTNFNVFNISFQFWYFSQRKAAAWHGRQQRRSQMCTLDRGIFITKLWHQSRVFGSPLKMRQYYDSKTKWMKKKSNKLTTIRQRKTEAGEKRELNNIMGKLNIISTSTERTHTHPVNWGIVLDETETDLTQSNNAINNKRPKKNCSSAAGKKPMVIAALIAKIN